MTDNERLLTDEELHKAWVDCYGYPIPPTQGLVASRTIASRQDAKTRRETLKEVGECIDILLAKLKQGEMPNSVE